MTQKSSIAALVRATSNSVTLLGRTHRVQLRVYDTRHPVHNPHGSVTFRVSALPVECPRSTSFSCKSLAKLVYYGDEAGTALWKAMKKFGLEIDPEEDFPPRLAAFFVD